MVASRRWFARIHPSADAAQLPVEGELPALDGATAWLNSPPLGAADLSGKVVLVDFWTYTCINWLRTLPYVRAWADRYAPQGLVVIGVHTPEFEFEHDAGNVRRAAQDMRVSYPVAMTTTTRYGAPSTTTTGPPSTLSMRGDISAIINSARASTSSRR